MPSSAQTQAALLPSNQPGPATQPGASTEQPTASAAQPIADTARQPASSCPSDMVLAEGLFCPRAEQRCEHQGTTDTQCQRYAQPSRCLTQHKQLVRVCVDRFEWPNQLGQKPLVLVGYDQAQALCESVGKRLCDEQEWSFACEGEQMLPYGYGYERDPTRCVIDRLASKPDSTLLAHDACLDDDACRSAFAKVDQREPSGSFRACVSPVGAHDMIGNVSEWVHLTTPDSTRGVAGGSWGSGPKAGPDRCRPASALPSKERSSAADGLSPERGFRCCRNAHPG